MPWLSEEVPEWEELAEDERERLRQVLLSLGMQLPERDDEDYFE